jgi:phosphohistidine swiveling domain-containing protein
VRGAREEIERIIGLPDPGSPTHSTSDPETFWTTTNFREAVPGAQTPLNWSIWSRATERAARMSAYRVGAFKRGELDSPMLERDRFIRAFHGRVALDISYMAHVGDRMPGTTGEETVESVFGPPPDGLVFEPTRRRYPIIALRLPTAFATIARRLRRLAADHQRWWSESVARVDSLGHPQLIDLFRESVHRFDRAMEAQVIGIISVQQPVFTALSQTVERAGAGDLSTLSGASGGAEMAVIRDIWDASRGRIEIADVTGRHGFHGPAEGEIESLVWREDEAPLQRMIDLYGERPDAEDPVEQDAERQRKHAAAERELLEAVPRIQRPAVKLVLRFARERLPMRGVGKRAFLQALDVARASGRRLGDELAAAGVLNAPEDFAYLAANELVDPPANAGELVAERRRTRIAQQQVELPIDFQGMPEPIPVAELEASAQPSPNGLVTGLGVSGGVVEGTARVVTDPTFAEVEPDEVLVAETTDPSWSSIMFISSALVMDSGGALSHAAVVARELEIPCVVNTQTGTKAIRTGDRVRVDGKAGTVEILE